MTLSFQILPYTLHFKQPAGTSRGVYRVRQSWYVQLWETGNPLNVGVGECAPLPDLSCDAVPGYATILSELCHQFCTVARAYSHHNIEEIFSDPDFEMATLPYPSMLFGLETALRHLLAGSPRLWDTPFSQGTHGITINGLIWMGKKEEMLRQIEQKMKNGFRCIKLKIGAIDFEEELALIAHIRSYFSAKEIEIRVDANGAFAVDDALKKLYRLSEFQLHSIEQPIRAGQWEAMANLVEKSPLPIALDEELIGINTLSEKQSMLDTIQPQYIILKPSLHGGIRGSKAWIAEADKRSIGWWITSALESNIGLNAIAQWCATLRPELPQGLGTGALFTDNIEMPLVVEGDQLWYKTAAGNPSGRFCRDREKQSLRLCGTTYPKELALTLAHLRLENPTTSEWEKEVYAFLIEWWSASPTLTVQTSGSTGAPKTILVEKERMMQSAVTTCTALNLKQGDSALLCLPVRYIAGKMMIVRALVAGLDLYPIAPGGHPLSAIPKGLAIDFAAMIPLQVVNSLQHEPKVLSSIRNCIIGGAAIDPELEKRIASLPNAWYSTYGMTETLSHIALRRLNGTERSNVYHPVDNVQIALSEDNTLVIHAPLICSETLITNDIARILPDGGFEILGRRDNVINSGGIKLQTEQIERKLADVLHFPFCITSLPDLKLGEKVVLLAQTEGATETGLLDAMRPHLDIYEMPRLIFFTEKIPLTENGKIDRKAAHIAVQQASNR